MTKYIFKKWPFNPGEKVALHWFRSPYRTKQNRWNFRLVFKNSLGELIPHDVSWGSLPNFKLGQIFQDGKALDTPIRGFNTSIYIPDLSKCEISKAIKIPPQLYLLKESVNWDEQCLIYKIEGQTIIIPCIEIVRSILTPMKIFANALLRPQGLEDLIDSKEVKNDTLYLNLSNNVPPNIIENNFVYYLSWLLYEENVCQIWDSVYRNIFDEEMVNNSCVPVKLATKMPMIGSRRLNVRALKRENVLLVLELSYIPGLKRPYNKICLSHDSFIERVTISNPGPRRPKRSKNDNTEPYYLVETGVPKNNSEQVIIDRFPTILGFDEPVEIVRERRKKLVRHGGTEAGGTVNSSNFFPSSEKNEEENLLSTGELEADGDLTPAEFRPEFIQAMSGMDGLENFIKAIDQVKCIVKHINITIDINELPPKGTYPFLTDGRLRKYALVKFEKQNFDTSYLLEIGRPDNKFLYTLVFKPRGQLFSNDQLDCFVSKLIDVLIDNNGCWDKDYLIRNKTVMIQKMRHVTNRTPINWAENIVEKLGYDVG